MDDSTRSSVASAASDDSSSAQLSSGNISAQISSGILDNLKHERMDPLDSFLESTLEKSVFHQPKDKSKRSYKAKQKSIDKGGVEKPLPKKRGRKSKKELLLMDKKVDYAIELQPEFKKTKLVKSPSQQKTPRPAKKSSGQGKVKKVSGSAPGPSVFDKKILAGPHLTMKQVLEYILTDHSYCVPPDPLPAVGNNHQMIRYILGPKNGAKPRSLPNVGSLDPEERSPLAYTTIARARGAPLSLSTPPSPASKLENLLKRGETSPLHLGGGALRSSHSKHLADCKEESDVDIDVEGVDPEPEKRVAYDVQKAREVMTECEKYVEFARDTDTGDNWESKIVKTGWTKTQSSLFDKVTGVLHAERLARLTYQSAGDTEPVLRRASLDKAACRVRRVFGEYMWDTKLTQWLHSVLTEFLNYDYLAIYMDVLQTLKSHCPQLITRMMKLSIITPLQTAYCRNNELQDLLTPYIEDNDSDKESPFEASVLAEQRKKSPERNMNVIQDTLQMKSTDPAIYIPAKSVAPQVEDAMVQLHSAKNAEAFRILLERQWDPFSPDLLYRLKKLSANPVFIVIAPGAIFTKLSLNRRLKQYYRMFNRVGKVVKVRPNNRAALECTSPSLYLEKLFVLAKEKIKDVRHCFPERPLFIVGWGSGSILAARLSVTTGPVDGIVALGFPLHSLREIQEDMLKVFGGIKHPILFVIGGLASNNSLTDMELFRRRLACETSLVVVGSGNENLYVARDHREKLLVTQSYVDKTIMDEIAYFVNLHSKHNQIIAANISMKPHHFSKSQNDGKKSLNLLRGKKRKSSGCDADHESCVGSNNEDSKDSYENEMDRTHDISGAKSGVLSKREVEGRSGGTYDYGFDGPKYVPSSKSSNKRKAHSSYRPDPSSTSLSAMTSSSCVTASQLLQQSPIAKRRMSKPSGPSQRVPMLNQQAPQRNITGPGQAEAPVDDAVALYKYLSEHDHSKTYPFSYRQNEGTFSGGNNERMGVAPYGDEKNSRKKSNTKSKISKPAKNSTVNSSASAIVSALNDVTTAGSNVVTNPIPPSSLDMHKYVLQHQEMMKQAYERSQDRSHSSQLFKLLSPGADSSDNIHVSTLPTSSHNLQQASSDLLKVKLIGSQSLPPSDVSEEARTALISKQNLTSNMSIPMIRLSRPGGMEESSHQMPAFMGSTANPGSGALLANLPSDPSEKFLLRATDNKSIMKVNASELKNWIAGGRGIQLITGVPTSSSLNIIVKKPPELNDTRSEMPSDVPGINPDPLVTSSLPAATYTLPAAPLMIPGHDQDPLIAAVPTEPTVSVDNNSVVAAPVAFTHSDMPKAEEVAAAEDPLPGSVEPMEVDNEEEMSGLLISSTFSVCPTSGERVLPTTCAESEAKSNPHVASGAILNPEIPGMDDSEEGLISVPIHIRPSSHIVMPENVVASGSQLTNINELATGIQNFGGEEVPFVSDSSSLTNLQPIQTIPSAADLPETTTLVTIRSIPPPPPPTNLCFAVKSKPKEIPLDDEKSKVLQKRQTTSKTPKSPRNESAKSKPKNLSSPSPVDSSVPSKPSKKCVKNQKAADKETPKTTPGNSKKSKERSKKETVTDPIAPTFGNQEATTSSPSSFKHAVTETKVNEDRSDEGAGKEENLGNDAKLVIPANPESASMDCPKQIDVIIADDVSLPSASTTTTTCGEEATTTETESFEPSDTGIESKTEMTSTTSSEEDKLRSKSNPVRRSARLKSGV